MVANEVWNVLCTILFSIKQPLNYYKMFSVLHICVCPCPCVCVCVHVQMHRLQISLHTEWWQHKLDILSLCAAFSIYVALFLSIPAFSQVLSKWKYRLNPRIYGKQIRRDAEQHTWERIPNEPYTYRKMRINIEIAWNRAGIHVSGQCLCGIYTFAVWYVAAMLNADLRKVFDLYPIFLLLPFACSRNW